MTNFLQNLINGLVAGSYYAVLGMGLTIIWGVLKIINVAHGDFYMLGAYMLYTFLTMVGVPVIPAVMIAVLVAAVLAMILERAILTPALTRDSMGNSPFVITLGMSILLQNFVQLIYGERYKSVPYFNDAIIKFLGVTLAAQRIIVVIVAFLAMFAAMLFIRKTRFGWAISATSQNTFAATLMGIDTKKIYMYTFGLAAGMTALSGGLLAPIYGINPWMGASIQLKSFVVCVIGGFGNIGGSIVAGLLLGLIESFAVQYIGTDWQNVLAYSLLILMFWFKPNGLFEKKGH
ncbi:branched-chain amino acid ABC transporter permease [Caproiciproducens sp. R1]|uniref:branched-chain amino acid ABC transporter permease n=1 Tax=Caproiciproducens sp. R1 TaxID=3435000 RepID=UPI00056E4FEA